MAKNSSLNFNIALDENQVPEKIEWNASDLGEKSECKALMAMLWDAKENNTLRIDLWTKEMTVDEMKIYFHQCLLSMADTFERATSESTAAKGMREYAQTFAKELGILS